MVPQFIKRYAMYLLRWQASTFILAPVIAIAVCMVPWGSAALANLIGGLIFFWVDKLIFRKKKLRPQWEIVEKETCSDCGAVGVSYRITEYKKYDRTEDKKPQYRCWNCAQIKLKIILDNE